MFVNRVKVESTVNQKKNNQVLRQSICDNCVFNKDIPYLSPKVKIFISSSNGAQFGNGGDDTKGDDTKGDDHTKGDDTKRDYNKGDNNKGGSDKGDKAS
ncbi:hypothetical protein GLOIN_2v1484458 [Rhizophagus irregularis DAOM 181602=DAOM 197198]|nr:hypothetical protein GLOIN_2v1484458 [Rhizophagus irregularis DAOM 181602=DAOM 197198]